MHGWTEVVKRGRRQQHDGNIDGQSSSSCSDPPATAAERATAPAGMRMQRAKKPEGGKVLSATEHGTKPTQRTPVSGVRRVWGTLKSTTTAAVRSTLKKLWPASDGLVVRRRVREYGASNKTRWWFILKGDENTLKKLENEWARIRMQTNWKLEHCTAPNNQPVANNDNPAAGESNSHGPENTSTSGTSIVATSPGVTVATIPNQVTDTQTDDNSASQSDSQSQHDDTNTRGPNHQQATGSFLISDSRQSAET